ncbi:Ger(x)C family spore germination protein [Alicyclobacillus sp. TC]|uniref:Germination protein, Ger(X)C family n=2 Tax=Alicyclobacillus tolerans TaxID=90970 RepID=A0A1M6WKA3_9BACL|nr:MULTISPECIES: Ger(x)C family spore germination protein [Alicyclobacillus]MDP9728286.1 spore germination protein KC [Alicyclobacillus tengchongensis]QRF23491.1 Ger(x)C family spore germination protein [Alicyclobacillus sp. TC]SHK94019.1 germination protein, Ger(x)C family [Alicyclobacillus montanus]
MNRRKTSVWITCLSILGICLGLTGCGEGTELKYVSMVSTVGAEQLNNHQVRLYLIPLSIEETEAQQQGGSSRESRLHTLIVRDGMTAFDIERNMIRETKHRLLFTHAKAVVISQSMAKHDLDWFLDIWYRDQQPRSRAYVFVTDDPVKDILANATWLEPEVSFPLSFGMENIRFVSNYATVDLIQCLKALHEPPYCSLLPMLHLHAKKKPMTVEYEGTALIQKNHMVDELNTTETQGLIWLLGQEKGGSLEIGESHQRSVVEITREKVEKHFQFSNGQLHVEYTLRLRGTLAQDGEEGDSWNPQHLHQLEEKANQTVQQICQQTLQKLQQKDQTDALGVGLMVYRKQPGVWRQYASHWNEVFQKADIHVHPVVTIMHPGLIRWLKLPY